MKEENFIPICEGGKETFLRTRIKGMRNEIPRNVIYLVIKYSMNQMPPEYSVFNVYK